MEIIYRQEKDRWVKGDRFVRSLIRRIIRGKRTQFSGVERVVINFLKGLERRGIEYSYNKSTILLNRSKKIISFGLGHRGVAGVHRDAPIIAAIGFPYPSEFPELCERYNVRKFLQHSQWILDLVKSAKKYDEHIFDLWPAGIDTEEWNCDVRVENKEYDVLLYNKIHWNQKAREQDLVTPIRNYLAVKGLSFAEICYGRYTIQEYKKKLNQSKAMIFLAEHESQGLAYQECMSCNVPVIAWDQGYWLDPDRFVYDRPVVPATSVPFFDERCGDTFKNADEFLLKFGAFFDNVLSGKFRPREYVVENVSIERSTDRMLEIYKSI